MENKNIIEIFNYIDRGNCVLLYGPGGTGKTHIIKSLRELFRDKVMYLTAMTGVAALGLNGDGETATTLHSWANIGTGNLPIKKIVSGIYKNKKSLDRWRLTEILVIDEISMMGGELFDKLNEIGKIVRNRRLKPFGGIKLILSGDFLQLPPINDIWIFKSKVWNTLNIKHVIFDIPYRYDDKNFFEILKRVRKGNLTHLDILQLEARIDAYEEINKNCNLNNIKPTILYSKNANVDFYNNKQLEKLKEPEFIFHAKDSFYKKEGCKPNKEKQQKLIMNKMVPISIKLRIGAQVMLRKNIDVIRGLVNGSRGIVQEIRGEEIRVRFVNNREEWIEYSSWEYEDSESIFIRKQIPLILAWAITIHKSQGCTLDYAICNIGKNIFTEGQGYVALSRVRNLKGLFLQDFEISSIKVNEEALEYSMSIEGGNNNFTKDVIVKVLVNDNVCITFDKNKTYKDIAFETLENFIISS
ncbi:MAG: AAA family ATPase, partial [Candidatus Thorarchaeota archaeon]